MSDLTTFTELRGLALPAVAGADGIFGSKGSQDVAWGDLLLAMFTPTGGRIMRRSFGSTLYQQLFEPVDPDDFSILEFTVRDAATQWLPHLRILDVSVSATPKGINISLRFSLKSDVDVLVTNTVEIPKTFISG